MSARSYVGTSCPAMRTAPASPGALGRARAVLVVHHDAAPPPGGALGGAVARARLRLAVGVVVPGRGDRLLHLRAAEGGAEVVGVGRPRLADRRADGVLGGVGDERA